MSAFVEEPVRLALWAGIAVLSLASVAECSRFYDNSYKLSALEKASATLPSVPPADPHTPAGRKVLTDEGVTLLAGTVTSTAECDKAERYIQHAASAGSWQLVYENAKAGESACLEAVSAISKLQLPPHYPAKAQADIKSGLEDLGMAYSLERGAMAKAAAIANSPSPRPSDIAEMRETVGRSRAYQADANRTIITVIRSVGVNLGPNRKTKRR